MQRMQYQRGGFIQRVVGTVPEGKATGLELPRTPLDQLANCLCLVQNHTPVAVLPGVLVLVLWNNAHP